MSKIIPNVDLKNLKPNLNQKDFKKSTINILQFCAQVVPPALLVLLLYVFIRPILWAHNVWEYWATTKVLWATYRGAYMTSFFIILIAGALLALLFEIKKLKMKERVFTKDQSDQAMYYIICGVSIFLAVMIAIQSPWLMEIDLNWGLGLDLAYRIKLVTWFLIGILVITSLFNTQKGVVYGILITMAAATASSKIENITYFGKTFFLPILGVIALAIGFLVLKVALKVTKNVTQKGYDTLYKKKWSDSVN